MPKRTSATAAIAIFFALAAFGSWPACAQSPTATATATSTPTKPSPAITAPPPTAMITIQPSPSPATTPVVERRRAIQEEEIVETLATTLSDSVLAFLEGNPDRAFTPAELWEQVRPPGRVLPCHVQQALERRLFVDGDVVAAGDVWLEGEVIKASPDTRWRLWDGSDEMPAGCWVYDPLAGDVCLADGGAELARHERVIERGLRDFAGVGRALLAIRDERLYREAGYETFEAYCQERWGIERRRAYQLMEAAAVAENVKNFSHFPQPRVESHVAALARLGPEQQAQAWQMAVETAPNGKVTAAHVKETVAAFTVSNDGKAGVTHVEAPPAFRLVASLAQVEDESVDSIVVYPPQGGEGAESLAQMYRAARPGASLFYATRVRYDGGTMAHPLDWLRDEANPWTLRQEIILDLGGSDEEAPSTGSGQAPGGLFAPHDERIYWMSKGEPALPEGDAVARFSTVWRFCGPVARRLAQRILSVLGRPGMTVLDACGSPDGAVLDAAVECGCEAIGVGISRED